MRKEEKAAATPTAREGGHVTAAPGAPVTREIVYEDVSAEPRTTVAARYGVSESFLAQICACHPAA